MQYLILAILFSVGVFVAMRLFERFKLDNHQALAWNYVFATIIGMLISSHKGTISLPTNEPWFGLSILTGFWFIFTYLLMTYSSQRSGVTITSLSSKLSVIIPTVFGVLLLHESLSLMATCGVLIAIVALFLVIGGKSQTKTQQKSGWVLPLLIFFGTGIGDILMKSTEQLHRSPDMTFMITFIYFMSAVFGIILVATDLIRHKSKWQWKNAIGGLGLGCVNFFSTFSIYQCMRILPNVILFPVYNIGVVCVAALTGFVLFKEKLTWKNYIGLALAIIAVLLITLKP